MKNWIWLDPAVYPQYQNSFYSAMDRDCCPDARFCIASFRKTFRFAAPVLRAELRISADTLYHLTVGDRFLGVGPAAVGGDFLCKHNPLPHYADFYEYLPEGENCELSFAVSVQHTPAILTDYSRGHGGLLVEGEVELTDGSVLYISTDETWEARVDRRHPTLAEWDETLPADPWCRARLTDDIWDACDSPIDTLSEQRVDPIGAPVLTVAPGETKDFEVEFDKIYAAYTMAELSGKAEAVIRVAERFDREGTPETVRSTGTMTFRSLKYHSTGVYRITLTNRDDHPVSLTPYLISAHYPIYAEGSFSCSDAGLNAVYEVCKWTLRICRQTLHLDSPMHQELLACTGDYYIESLMTAFTFGDMALAEFDVKRTADWLVANDGVMFHTSYSLIWVLMLRDVYLFTGSTELLRYCLRGLNVLLAKFESYLGENDLLEKAPNYMFVDWTELDGYNMHHPPKYLGQSVLNAFYYGALRAASFLYRTLDDTVRADGCDAIAARVKTAFCANLYDPARGLFFEGLGTPTVMPLIDMPANEDKRFFAAYSNILACLFGISEGEEARRIMKTVATDPSLPDIQPYFMHWELEALDATGLFAEYGMEKLCRWKALAEECPKGLKEGWFAPPDYQFDYSHAWGGTPAYQLPARLLGFRMEEAGFRKISLCPRLFGLKNASVTMPTPYGDIICRMEQGKAPDLSVPEGIEWSLRQEN